MSAAAVAWEVPNRVGYFKVRRGLPEKDMPAGEKCWNYEQLVYRVGGDPAWIWTGLADRASIPGAPEYLKPDFAHIKRLFHRTSDRWLFEQFKILSDAGVWVEDPKRRGYFKVLPEMIDPAPQIAKPVKYGCGAPGKPKPKPAGRAVVSAPSDVAALNISCKEATNGQEVGAVGVGAVGVGAVGVGAVGPGGIPEVPHLLLVPQSGGSLVSGGCPDSRNDANDQVEVARHPAGGGAVLSAVEADGTSIPDADVAGDGSGRVTCPQCAGRGYIERGAQDDHLLSLVERSFHSGSGEVERSFQNLETGFRPESDISSIYSGLRAVKTLDLREEKQARSAAVDPSLLASERNALNLWISQQPWGRVNSMRRQGLSDEQAHPVIQAVHAAGRRVEDFLTFLHNQKITLSPDRENVTGLLISLVKGMAAFASYSARNRPLDRSGGPPG